jgi:hypothetical protein
VRANFHPDRRIDPNAYAAQNSEQLGLRTEAGAATDQIISRAFKDGDVSADGAKQIRCEQTAKRAADHQRARLMHVWRLQGLSGICLAATPVGSRARFSRS